MPYPQYPTHYAPPTMPHPLCPTHNAPPIREEVFPPGVPTVERHGPLLPALETNTTPCSSASSLNCFTTALMEEVEEGRGEEGKREREEGEERDQRRGLAQGVQPTQCSVCTLASTYVHTGPPDPTAQQPYPSSGQWATSP